METCQFSIALSCSRNAMCAKSCWFFFFRNLIFPCALFIPFALMRCSGWLCCICQINTNLPAAVVMCVCVCTLDVNFYREEASWWYCALALMRWLSFLFIFSLLVANLRRTPSRWTSTRLNANELRKVALNRLPMVSVCLHALPYETRELRILYNVMFNIELCKSCANPYSNRAWQLQMNAYFWHKSEYTIAATGLHTTQIHAKQMNEKRKTKYLLNWTRYGRKMSKAPGAAKKKFQLYSTCIDAI